MTVNLKLEHQKLELVREHLKDKIVKPPATDCVEHALRLTANDRANKPKPRHPQMIR